MQTYRQDINKQKTTTLLGNIGTKHTGRHTEKNTTMKENVTQDRGRLRPKYTKR